LARPHPRDGTPTEKQLAEQFCPCLVYDSQAVYRAASAATLTDNPGNWLARKNEVVASTSGVPMLSLAFLKDRAQSEGARKEKLHQAPDRLAMARGIQADSRYRDRAYWRITRTHERTVIQYWLWFYYVPREVLGDLEGHEGAWRVVQVEVGDDGPDPRPIRVNAGPRAGTRDWTAVDHVEGDHPVLFVAPFTQDLYFDCGVHRRLRKFDRSDGEGPRRIPRLEQFGGWQWWPGTWGGTSLSPRSPHTFSVWDNPLGAMRTLPWEATRAAFYNTLSNIPLAGRALRRIVRFVERSLGLSVDGPSPEEPRIDARLERNRVAVAYELGERRPTRLHVTVHVGDSVVAAETITQLEQNGELVVDLPETVASCAVLVTGLATSGLRSSAARTPKLTANSPDQLEKAVFDSVLSTQLKSDEVMEFSSREGLKIGAPRLGKSVRQSSQEIWRIVASETQAFRDARSSHVQREYALKAGSRARMRCLIYGAIAILITAAIAAAAIASPAAGVGVLGITWAYIWLAAAGSWAQWKRWRKAVAARLRWHDPFQEDEETPLMSARRRFENALRELAIGPAIRREINKRTLDRYDDDLDFGAAGLPELRGREHEVQTPARDELDELTARMHGGSIGIAGQRGAGKSTLIKAYCEPRDSNDRRLTTVISAPVKYEAREFVLTLFGQLCEKVLVDPAAARVMTHAPSRLARKARLSAYGPVALSTPLTFAVAAALLKVCKPLWLDMAVVVLATVVVALSVLWTIKRVRRAETRAVGVDPERALRARAERELDDIRFQQSWSTGYAGKLSLPIPVSPEVQVTSTEQATAKQATFPEIVERLRSFLALAAAARGGVVIGIDEMDKMESGEVAQKFLNEIKAIFGVGRCFYLVSISEGAMSTFEQRGLPFRDVFDSSFDEVISVAPLGLEASKGLLRRRVIGLGPPFLDFCHCLTGGLPRDLLRAARRLSLYDEEDKSLPAVCKVLAISELERKVAAAAVSARQIALEPYVSELLFWLRGLSPGQPSSQPLLDRSSKMPGRWARESLGSHEMNAVDSLERVRLELAAFSYFIATVVRFFCEFEGDPRAHFEPAEREIDGESQIDRLAKARAAFEQNPSLAVSRIDAFRLERSWETPGVPAWSRNGAGTDKAPIAAGVSGNGST
jgi:hypothetical protein